MKLNLQNLIPSKNKRSERASSSLFGAKRDWNGSIDAEIKAMAGVFLPWFFSAFCIFGQLDNSVILANIGIKYGIIGAAPE